jgi:putative intracellular protease/amidase
VKERRKMPRVDGARTPPKDPTVTAHGHAAPEKPETLRHTQSFRDARWLLKDELKDLGVDFACGEIWKPYTVVDRNLYTGQHSAAAGVLAERLLKEALAEALAEAACLMGFPRYSQ